MNVELGGMSPEEPGNGPVGHPPEVAPQAPDTIDDEAARRAIDESLKRILGKQNATSLLADATRITGRLDLDASMWERPEAVREWLGVEMDRLVKKAADSPLIRDLTNLSLQHSQYTHDRNIPDPEPWLSKTWAAGQEARREQVLKEEFDTRPDLIRSIRTRLLGDDRHTAQPLGYEELLAVVAIRGPQRMVEDGILSEEEVKWWLTGQLANRPKDFLRVAERATGLAELERRHNIPPIFDPAQLKAVIDRLREQHPTRFDQIQVVLDDDPGLVLQTSRAVRELGLRTHEQVHAALNSVVSRQPEAVMLFLPELIQDRVFSDQKGVEAFLFSQRFPFNHNAIRWLLSQARQIQETLDATFGEQDQLPWQALATELLFKEPALVLASFDTLMQIGWVSEASISNRALSPKQVADLKQRVTGALQADPNLTVRRAKLIERTGLLTRAELRPLLVEAVKATLADFDEVIELGLLTSEDLMEITADIGRRMASATDRSTTARGPVEPWSEFGGRGIYHPN